MRRNRLLLSLIIFIAIVSAVVDLPSNFPIKFTVGSIKIDQTIRRPDIDWTIGPFTLKKNLDARYGLDLAGGTHLVLEADMSKIDSSDRESAFAGAKNVVERRVNLYGLTEPIVQQSKIGGSYRVIVEIPGITAIDQAIDLIGKTAQLSFHEEATPSASGATPSSFLEMWSKSTGLTGKNLKRSEITFDPKTGKPQVALEFDTEGSRLFADITSRNVGKTVAIFLDEQLLSAPQVNEAISGGKAVIQGSFSMDEAKRLSIALSAGALPVPLKIIEQRNIGATLGKESIENSIVAGIIGLFIIALFMLVNYGFLGLIADLALVIYALVVFALFKIIPVNLTLAGIAGFILSIGMAVDANILIFERMKEEIRWGKDRISAITLGFDRAFPSIRDSNISSLITCAILYWFGTGIVRGFAITLAIGIVVSLFSAITITRTFLRIFYK
ncbi:protein translocase subunit SecD [Candidatus Gottesmanbacteria bacterium]|nr:protein translocase subunit SecD [Candidatus Gottesmanbacteria bacterium]